MTNEKFKIIKPYADAICQAANIIVVSSLSSPPTSPIILMARNIQNSLNHPKIKTFILNSEDENLNYIHAILVAQFVLNTFVYVK